MENGKQIFQAYRECQAKFDKISYDHRVILASPHYTFREKREMSELLNITEKKLNNFKEKIIYALEKYSLHELEKN